MMNTTGIKLMTAAMALGVAAGTSLGGIELTTNGDFETGDTSGWVTFLSGTQTFGVTGVANSGAFGGELFNDVTGSAAVIKQANLGIGVVQPGDMITISFFARGSGEAGGVQFAEFFSEIDGGGVSSSQILSGGPLFPPSGSFQFYTFNVLAGPDVSAGITLQFNAATGANLGSTSLLIIDDVSVTVIPTPASAALLGLGGFASIRRRR